MEDAFQKIQQGLLLAQSNGCSVYQFSNETGEGTMTCYEVFPGTMLSFNDFHMAYFESEYVPGRDILQSITAGRAGWSTLLRRMHMHMWRRET